MSAASEHASSTVAKSRAALSVITYATRVAIAANARIGTSSGRITRMGWDGRPVGGPSSMPPVRRVPRDGSAVPVQADQLGRGEDVALHRGLDGRRLQARREPKRAIDGPQAEDVVVRAGARGRARTAVADLPEVVAALLRRR